MDLCVRLRAAYRRAARPADLYHVHIIAMNGGSFPLASSRKRQKNKEGSMMP